MNLDKFNELINSSTNIVIIQADNPDGDSLSSSLALEALLGDIGKMPTMYCGVDIPTYLRHIKGWDRVVRGLPKQFDLSIIVDTSSISLLESLTKSGEVNWLKTKACIIIDHHATDATIDFATLVISEPSASTGELICTIADQNTWKIELDCAEYLATSILFDTLGLTTESVTSKTLLAMSKLLEKGVSLAKLEEKRRLSNKKSFDLVKYKAKLLGRIDLSIDERIATVDIPWSEIEKYSHEYNPSMLVMDEMRMISGVMLAIAFKSYPNGKITAKIRTNLGVKIADKLAEHFGGGGHAYAAGFKVNNSKDLQQIKLECINKAVDLLNSMDIDEVI